MPTIFQIAMKTDTVSLHERKRGGEEGRGEESERETKKQRKREMNEKWREPESNKGRNVLTSYVPFPLLFFFFFSGSITVSAECTKIPEMLSNVINP